MAPTGKSIILALALLCGAQAFSPALVNKRMGTGLFAGPATGTGPSLDYNPDVRGVALWLTGDINESSLA